jgi:murein L,D-transpeptidase YafK
MMHTRRRWVLLLLVLPVLSLGLCLRARVARVAPPAVQRVRGLKTVADRQGEDGPSARARLDEQFRRAGLSYPPKAVIVAAFKQERILDLYAASAPGAFRFVRSYPILAASGKLGPKLKYGDCQVPEGIYEIESLNPNSLFHLALRLNYPNAFDRRQGRKDGRRDLGRDIMIHGGAASVGCIAIGDGPIEEVFGLATDTGIDKVSVVISPVDFRVRSLPPEVTGLPEWTGQLYSQIRQRLAALPRQSME